MFCSGWTRLGDSYEEAQNGNSVCCGRNSGSGGQSSNVCLPSQRSPHYKDVNGQCLPSCGHAANMAGYGGYGPDGQPRTSDDPHVYGSDVSSCANLTRFGHSDWKDFSWTDKRTSKTMNNSQIHSVILRGGVCCVRGNPRERRRRRPPTTSTSTSSTGGSSRRVENPPNMKRVAERIARQCPNKFRAAPYSNGGSLEYTDLVIQILREKDKRWGYTFWTRPGRPDRWSADRLGYYRGVGNPTDGSLDMAVIDYVYNDGSGLAWHNATEGIKRKYPDAKGYWKYSRPGAKSKEVLLSECTGTP